MHLSLVALSICEIAKNFLREIDKFIAKLLIIPRVKFCCRPYDLNAMNYPKHYS